MRSPHDGAPKKEKAVSATANHANHFTLTGKISMIANSTLGLLTAKARNTLR